MEVFNLSIAFRRFKRDKISSSINLIGLAIGLAVTILVAFYINNELSYESCFPNSDQIYRITQKDNSTHWAAIPPTIGIMVKERIPEIIEVARLSLCMEQIIGIGEKSFTESRGCNADNSIFSVFAFQWISGNSKTALNNPSTVVLSESLANKYFGKNDAIDRIISIDGNDMSITGVVKDLPLNTHLKFDYFVSMTENFDDLNRYGRWMNFFTYCLLRKSSNHTLVENKFDHFMNDYMQILDSSKNEKASLSLQPINKIHLFSNLEKEIPGNSNIAYIYIFSIIAILVLFISCANYVNLSVIKTFKRINEFGVKRTLGARKKDLVMHFFYESFVYVIFATILAIIIMLLIKENYGHLFDLNLRFSYLNIIVIVSILILVPLLVSFYPASFISKYNVNDALKSKKYMDTRFRKALVVFQFAASIFLIICTIGIHSQMKFIRDKNLGFDKTATIAVKLYGNLYTQFQNKGDVLKNELLKNPDIQGVSLTSYELGKRIGYADVIPVSVKDRESLPEVRVINTDGKLISLLKMKIIKGSNFKENSKSFSVILNQAAIDAFGFNDPLNEQVIIGDTKCDIIGIVQDFNYSSLHGKVEPLAITNIPFWLVNLYVKINSSNIKGALTDIENIIRKTSSGSLFTYSFLDETIGKQYITEQRMNKLFNVFTFFAVFIACLGLVVLSIFSAELRTKEIGIRKVYGAKTIELLSLLYKEYVGCITLAFIIAGIISWFIINKWLENFAYRTSIKAWYFVLALAIISVLALITVSWQVWKTARRNPIESLKYE